MYFVSSDCGVAKIRYMTGFLFSLPLMFENTDVPVLIILHVCTRNIEVKRDKIMVTTARGSFLVQLGVRIHICGTCGTSAFLP